MEEEEERRGSASAPPPVGVRATHRRRGVTSLEAFRQTRGLRTPCLRARRRAETLAAAEEEEGAKPGPGVRSRGFRSCFGYGCRGRPATTLAIVVAAGMRGGGARVARSRRRRYRDTSAAEERDDEDDEEKAIAAETTSGCGERMMSM